MIPRLAPVFWFTLIRVPGVHFETRQNVTWRVGTLVQSAWLKSDHANENQEPAALP